MRRYGIYLVLLLAVAAPPGTAGPEKPDVRDGWTQVQAGLDRYTQRGAPEIRVAGRLKKDAAGVLWLGNLAIAPASKPALIPFLGQTLEVQGKLRESYRFDQAPPLEVGSLRPINLQEEIQARLGQIEGSQGPPFRRAVRWLRRGSTESLVSLYRIAKADGPLATPARALLRKLGVKEGLYLELTLSTRAITDDEKPTGTARLIALDPAVAVAPAEKGTLQVTVTQAGHDPLILTAKASSWTSPKERPEVRALFSITAPITPIKSRPKEAPQASAQPAGGAGVEEPLIRIRIQQQRLAQQNPWGQQNAWGQQNLAPQIRPAPKTPLDRRLRLVARLTVQSGKSELSLASEPVSLRRLTGEQKKLDPAELDRQAQWVDRLGSARLAERAAARKELARVADPAYHLLERAMDDAAPQVRLAAGRLRWWYPKTVPYLGISYNPAARVGVQVTAVLEGSPAYLAGIRPGDTIQKIDGIEPRQVVLNGRSVNSLHDHIRKQAAGKTLAMIVSRGNKILELQVILGRIEPGVFGSR